jgi:hypothetical protein
MREDELNTERFEFGPIDVGDRLERRFRRAGGPIEREREPACHRADGHDATSRLVQGGQERVDHCQPSEDVDLELAFDGLQRQDLHGAWCKDAGVADEYIKTRLVQLIGNLADPSLNGALLGDIGDRQRYSTVRRGGKVVHLVVVERGAEDLVALRGQLECNLATEPASCAGDCAVRCRAVECFTSSP